MTPNAPSPAAQRAALRILARLALREIRAQSQPAEPPTPGKPQTEGGRKP